MIFLVSLKDLSSIEGSDLTTGTEAEVIARVRRLYDFLPRATEVTIVDGAVRIEIPRHAISNKLEASRLQEKASQRAKQGDYQKAVSIWSRVLNLIQPTL